MTITQELFDKYAAERIQPLADALLALAQNSGYDVREFYQACTHITITMLQRAIANGADSEVLSDTIEFLGNVAMQIAEYEIEKRSNTDGNT